MPAEENIELVRRYFREVWNKGNMDAADQMVAADFGSSGCGPMSGREALKLFISSYREAYPRSRFTLLSLVCEGNNVIACWALQGSHAGKNAQKSGSNIATGLSVYRIVNGKIAEAWATTDELGTSRPLGISRVAEPQSITR